MIRRRPRWIPGSIAVFFLICCYGHAREILDLYPERPGALVCWTENRTDPRPLQICFLKIALNVKELEVLALPGDDPDGPGPAESRLTQPLQLFEKYRALAAVNANAFAGLGENSSAYPHWYEGQRLKADEHRSGWMPRGNPTSGIRPTGNRRQRPCPTGSHPC